MIENIDRKQSLKKSASPDLARDLEDCMSGISEKYFFSCWQSDLEFTLWREISETCKERKITYSESFILKKFSDDAEGWFWWPDTVKDGPVFVTINEWKQIYEKARVD